jgi:hypothetical protein
MARSLEGKLIHCKSCGGASRQWVRWCNWTGNTVYYFCDNDCLTWWLAQERTAGLRDLPTAPGPCDAVRAMVCELGVAGARDQLRRQIEETPGHSPDRHWIEREHKRFCVAFPTSPN